MAEKENRSLDSLNLSWPHLVNYQVDIAGPHASTLIGDREAESADTGQRPVTTYNGVPRELLRITQPLFGDEIRVLDLNRGTRTMPLTGSLRKVRLSNTDGYEPLSYTWEDYDTVQHPEDNTKDYFHTKLCLLDTGICLDLTSNCAKALRSVRKPTTDRTIWVDSICVNQDDPEERSRQVDMMKDIYARAFTVLVYLGGESTDDEGSSTIAMSLLAQPDRLQKSHLLQRFETRSLKRLFERPYFQRMWIVQEVALAQTIEFHCGPATAYVSKFAGKPLKAILGSRVTPPWLRHSKQTDGYIPGSHTQAGLLLTLVLDTALCTCKDDRDRIFALLSLVDPGRTDRLIPEKRRSPQERLKADYNLSTAQVFTGTAAYLVKNGLLWGVLMLARHRALNNCPGLPSWVPDWKSLGGPALRSPQLLNLVMSTSKTLTSDTVSGVNSSGAIHIRGMLLGSVTNSGSSLDHLFHSAYVDKDQLLSAQIFPSEIEPDAPNESHGNVSIWSLVKLVEKPLDIWEWHLKFFTHCNQSRNLEHFALMLPDYSTVLILRPHDSLPDQYTLVDIGKPLVRVVWPAAWAVDHHPGTQIGLDFLKSTIDWEQPYWDTILSSQEVFPRLSDYHELWGLNPFTFTMTLTHTVIDEILRTDMSELYLLDMWQKHGRIGVEILRDKTQLRQLIDEVKNLQDEDYVRREKAAGLNRKWSLGHFLGLFLKDPFHRVPIEGPQVQVHGDQPLDRIDALEQLMQWAQVTYRFLTSLWKESFYASVCPNPIFARELYSEAMDVARFQVSTACINATNDASCGKDRTAFLLEKILSQLSDERDPELRQLQGPLLRNKGYWDWQDFNIVIKERFSFLNHIRPDVEKIQADLHDSRPDFGFITAHQVLAAHGFDPRKKDFTKIKIR